MREDVGLLTRPFIVGQLYELVARAQHGDPQSLSKDEARLVEPLIKEVRRIAKKQKRKKQKRKSNG